MHAKMMISMKLEKGSLITSVLIAGAPINMNQKIWDLYAPIYEIAMKKDAHVYEYMYQRIPKVIKDQTVLEIATGPGLLAKYVAQYSNMMIATDYSRGMIQEARKTSCPSNLFFEVADATDLPYEDASFDVVIIANALHVMPDPETALKEIRRVLKDEGILIAPNFVNHKGTLWSKILQLAGISFDHQWTTQEYLQFLKDNDWNVQMHIEMQARIPIVYTECTKEKQ